MGRRESKREGATRSGKAQVEAGRLELKGKAQVEAGRRESKREGASWSGKTQVGSGKVRVEARRYQLKWKGESKSKKAQVKAGRRVLDREVVSPLLPSHFN